jgi:hypothetical protein
MSGEPSELEKYIEKFLRKIMVDKMIYVQALSTRELQASPLNGLRFGHFNPVTEQRSKHHDDLDNEKKILSILPDYIPPLAGVINHENIPRDYEYTLITMYIPKGIHIV